MLYYILLSILWSIGAKEIESSPAIDEIFSYHKIEGTFVIYDITKDKLVIHNLERSRQGFSPASTFKIPNSLIGLSSKALKSVDEVFYNYDGSKLYLSSWEKNMSLREAIKVSHVLAYQELARKIGAKTMQENIKKLAYGNQQMGETLDNFWLDGSLAITATQQAEFLAKLAQHQLPYPEDVQLSVQEIIKKESGNGWVLYGKTGWTGSGFNPSIGWFVGWVEEHGKIYSFALNMDIYDNSQLPKREQLAKEALQAYGLLK